MSSHIHLHPDRDDGIRISARKGVKITGIEGYKILEINMGTEVEIDIYLSMSQIPAAVEGLKAALEVLNER